MESLLDTRAGLETLKQETHILIAYYEGCIAEDDAVRLNMLSAAKISRVRHKIAKYPNWLAKNVAAFRPLEEKPSARWKRVNDYLPERLLHGLESHRETVRDCRNSIELDAQTVMRIDDFARRYGNYVIKAQNAIRELVGVYEGFEWEICRRLETSQPAVNMTGEKNLHHAPDRTPPKPKRGTTKVEGRVNRGRRVDPDIHAKRELVLERWQQFGECFQEEGYTRKSFEFFAVWATGKFDDMPSDDPVKLAAMVNAHRKTPAPKECFRSTKQVGRNKSRRR